MGGAYRFAAWAFTACGRRSNRMSVFLRKPCAQRLGPQRSFDRALDVDQSQIGGSLSNVVVMGKVVFRYLNASVACG